MNPSPLSVNALAEPLVRSLLADAEALRLRVERGGDGVTYVDAGIECRGGIEAGRRIAAICMGGLGRVRIDSGGGDWPRITAVLDSRQRPRGASSACAATSRRRSFWSASRS